MPKVSVIMPVYNGEKYLGEAIDSILGQTYQDFEFIIINDCSTDRTEDIILAYTDPRIIYLKNEVNLRIAATLNRGIKLAKGEYIARMDADDISNKRRLQKQVEFLDSNYNIGVVGSDILLFGEGRQDERFRFSRTSKQLKANLFFHTCLAHPTVMIRKKALEKAKIKYEINYEGMEDYVMWWRISKEYEIGLLPEVLLHYRQHVAQVTKNYSEEIVRKMKNFLEERLSVFDIDFSEREKQLLLSYCCDNCKYFSDNNIKDYIRLLQRILKQNANIKYYEQKALQHTLGLSLSYVIQEGNVVNKKFLYRQGVRQGVISIFMAAKLLVKGYIL